jgi:hypothetical protein|tara:strand:+ start:998 stop:1150 length:153 start_codon:yes stop_codon:yes gene_type:complete
MQITIKKATIEEASLIAIRFYQRQHFEFIKKSKHAIGEQVFTVDVMEKAL